ncbi:HAD family hydrolase [Dongia soli]|uniref:HAD family hydrolase n=1 Tax=Dongia soli TaxID=600628 RepID=A0ABU5EBJ1_9PROT|nr:HAD family hydrolase [Dongia soli]MDY0883365.1 HAD family hydrolase [Dongia soli]
MARYREYGAVFSPARSWPRVALWSLLLFVLGIAARIAQADDPLPSWRDGEAKAAIIHFVERVTTPGADYLMPAERVAVFDNDGTLCPEMPVSTQFAFTLDRLRAMAPAHPLWRDTEPFKSALAGDIEAVAAGGDKAILQLMTVTHSGMSTDDFDAMVRDWLTRARHPRFGRPYTRLVYQPMLELLIYLRSNGFSTYIVASGGTDFMRSWVEQAYGIPPEQVIGSSSKLLYEIRNGEPVLMRQRAVDFINDGDSKPIAIHKVIGRRPILAFGNSDRDIAMLEWATMQSRPTLGLLLHHTDAEREYAYDRKAFRGRLEQALATAPARHWVIVDMRRDWAKVFRD